MLTSRFRRAVYTTSTTTCNLGASPAVNNRTRPFRRSLSPARARARARLRSGQHLRSGRLASRPALIPYLTADAGDPAARLAGSGPGAAQRRFRRFHARGRSDPIGFALGGEYRKYTRSADCRRAVADGRRARRRRRRGPELRRRLRRQEVYGEIIAPLVQDRPFFDEPDPRGGIRYSAYKVDAPGNPSYNTTTWKAAAPGSRSTASGSAATTSGRFARRTSPSCSRRPTVGLTNLAIDPCRTRAIPGGHRRSDRQSARGLPRAGRPAGVDRQHHQPDRRSGQRHRRAATSTCVRKRRTATRSALVFQPEFVPRPVDHGRLLPHQDQGRDFAAHRRRSHHELLRRQQRQAITAASATDPTCPLFRRNPVHRRSRGDPATTGGLVFPLSNSGCILTDGIDVGVNYRRDLGFAKLNSSFQGNWTNRSNFQATVPGSIIPPGFPAPAARSGLQPRVRRLLLDNCGSPGSAGPNSAPGRSSRSSAGTSAPPDLRGHRRVAAVAPHLEDAKPKPASSPIAGVLPGRRPPSGRARRSRTVDFGHIGAHELFDLAFRFGVSENLDLTLTVTNLSTRIRRSSVARSVRPRFNSGNTYPSTYDALGRRFAIGGRLKF